jgi:acyl-[acyl carrier protein]--UDP-N-acetylglucosamine O-acyltransferase
MKPDLIRVDSDIRFEYIEILFMKPDALIHVAHNVEIGRNSMLNVSTIIGGSSKISDAC